ncbi:MAG: protein kinase [Myxococcota bacterium]|nr:protein kinase [Myxococcota bacterium]
MASLEEQLSATIEARMGEILQDGRTLDRNPRSTIAPDRSRPDAAGRHAIELLRIMAPSGAGIEVHETIGEGGMGVVRNGTQIALGREVAIKTLKADARSEGATLKLLREAWVTGALEHPNVVPVYDISLDADGVPQIVLKKIGGSQWADLMRDDKALRQKFQTRDPFEWNLRTLVQVCNAVHFAHSRGILHRDLKPENVMIGEFGEVYVLDWGIAVSLRDDGTGRLPLAKDATEMAGTPAYMAPEMLGDRPGMLTPRTDVYLLGAVLYEVLAGHPPHDGKTLGEIVFQVIKSAPPLPEHVPAEIARIVRRAMDPDPDARFENVEQLRLALIGFLEHRGSLKLAEEAEVRLGDLLAERDARGSDADEQRLRLYHLFGECRFGFLEALRIWRDNEQARDGLRRAISTMIELELEQGDPKAAALLLAELDDAPAELAARVREAKALRSTEDARRAALAHDFDASIGRRTRVFVGLILGTIWTVAPWIGFGLERRHGTPPLWVPLLSAVAILVFASGLGYWARESLRRTEINRRLTRTVGIMLVAQIALFAGAWGIGVEYAKSRVLLLLLYAVISALAAATIEARMWPSAVAFMIGFALACVWPGYEYPFQSVANLVLTVNVVVVWGRIEDDVVVPLRERREQRMRSWQAFLERRAARESIPPGGNDDG